MRLPTSDYKGLESHCGTHSQREVMAEESRHFMRTSNPLEASEQECNRSTFVI